MTVREIVYMILDLAKANTSDDSFFTSDHVIFLIKKYRSFLIKKEQEKKRSTSDVFSDFEYQEICLDLEKAAAIDGSACNGGYYLRSKNKIPKLLEGVHPKVYPIDYFQGIHIVYISKDKMKYIGTNKFLKNILYVAIGSDLHIYLNSNNPQFLYLKKLKMSAIFEDFEEVSEYQCEEEDSSTICNNMDRTFPIRDSLVPTLIELVVKELIGAAYRPVDTLNDANDNLSDIATFIRRYMKNNLQQQMGV